MKCLWVIFLPFLLLSREARARLESAGLSGQEKVLPNSASKVEMCEAAVA